MILKPVIKTSSSRQKVAEWIVEKFPPGYQSYEYLEPFLGDGSVLLHKEPSVEEVAADSDVGLVCVWRAVRDEQSTFSSRVKRIDHSRTAFDRYSKASGGDYMDEAIREFVLRQMSKSALKRTYLPRDGKVKCRDCWCDLFDRMPHISDRVKDVFFISRCATEMLRAFNHAGCLTFCDPPQIEPGTSEFHSDFGNLMRNFRGKAVVAAKNSAMYRRLFSEWNRRSIPGGGNESLWVNF